MAAQEKRREDEVTKAKDLSTAVEAALSAAEPRVAEGQRCLQRTSTASMAQLVSLCGMQAVCCFLWPAEPRQN